MAENTFDRIVDRRGTDSYKWDEGESLKGDVIPMWVADMDFRVADCIIEALHKRVEHGVFGYTSVPETYYESVINWFSRRHNWTIERDWIQYTSGVVPAISVTIKAFTTPGDKVIVMTPVYNCFFSSIRNNECETLKCPLKYCLSDEGVVSYSIDYESLEKMCSDPRTKILLFCNPHNPAGRVWTKEELQKVGCICRKHDVIVVSDEIHCEIVMPGHKFIPFASVSGDNQDCCITLNSPSKSFNTAGLQIANIITNNPEWAKRINKAINVNEVCDVNPFGVIALQAAYGVPSSGRYPIGPGEEWLKGMNKTIWENYCLLREMFKEEIPSLPIAPLEGTYLAWIDCRSLLGKKVNSSEEIEEYLLHNYRVWINAGSMYGDDNFIRINLACPGSVAKEGLRRIVTGLKELL
ncbi:MAG: pyridoxal phosphate-dependent aminotransferase [Bacteroidales bacterium]|nr:pyridoxal phosphate-dependent aminotransferase [Bacteroidales bacterium]